MNSISPSHYKIAISSALLSLAAYPLIRYFNFFCLKNLDFYYLSEEVESNIIVFRKKTFSHSETRGNTTTYYFNISDPIGYMTKEEKEKEFKVVTTASKYFQLSLLNATLCTGILIWALLRE
jgi:hypothetical protein